MTVEAFARCMDRQGNLGTHERGIRMQTPCKRELDYSSTFGNHCLSSKRFQVYTQLPLTAVRA